MNDRPLRAIPAPAEQTAELPHRTPDGLAFVMALIEYNARLLRALRRESHHIDQRAGNTDRPTRERLTGGRPAGRMR